MTKIKDLKDLKELLLDIIGESDLSIKEKKGLFKEVDELIKVYKGTQRKSKKPKKK